LLARSGEDGDGSFKSKVRVSAPLYTRHPGESRGPSDFDLAGAGLQATKTALRLLHPLGDRRSVPPIAFRHQTPRLCHNHSSKRAQRCTIVCARLHY